MNKLNLSMISQHVPGLNYQFVVAHCVVGPKTSNLSFMDKHNLCSCQKDNFN